MCDYLANVNVVWGTVFASHCSRRMLHIIELCLTNAEGKAEYFMLHFYPSTKAQHL